MKQKQDISFLLHPKDRSLEAYRGWITTMLIATRRNPPGDLTQLEWQKRCEEFWRDYDAKHPGEVPR